MANSKDNLSKYGKSFIGFDEPSGNAMDSIGGNTGTNFNTNRLAGWNGKGWSMNFNGLASYLQFNAKVIPIGAKSIRFKIKVNETSLSTFKYILSNTIEKGSGLRFVLQTDGSILVSLYQNSEQVFQTATSRKILDGQWHDVLFTWDGTISSNAIKVYIDDLSVPDKQSTAITKETINPTNNLIIGKHTISDAHFFNGQLDSIEIYDRVISPIPDKYLVQHNSDYKYHDGTSWQSTTNTEENFIQYGMNNFDHIKEAQWKELSGDKSVVMWSDFEDKQFASVVLNKKDFKAQDLLGESPQAIYYTDSDTSKIVVETGVDPYSVYDYIGELPTVVAYTESTDDIIVSTTTEPFDIYDEFGDSVEVLYYTDDEAVKEADLILEANWSPVDELEGDFEVVTWTDEAPETAQRVLEMTAVPKPQFIKLVNPKRLYGYLDDVFVNDISQSYRDEARYFVTGEDTSRWYVWDKSAQTFVVSDASTEEAILKNGMKYHELNSITDKQWKTWGKHYINIGVFLKDNPRDTIVSVVESISYEDYLPRNTTTIEKTNFYILNTTAKIDLSFVGNTLKGVLSDDDLTRVQYRVLLNGGYYYPADGSFTKLSESPHNINLSISSKDTKIDNWNNLKVEFQDSFGTTDYWQANFIGTYSGLIFKDVYGKYYSNEIGEVLKYLDFGIIIAGQTTVEHEIFLKNQYGYDVKNIHLYANTSNFPTGMSIEFSESSAPFTPYPELKLNRTLQNNEEMSFFVRLTTELGATPDANGSFDIIVRADKA
ncbi:LamG domain-containing protein [Lysinibacillus sp. CNPSo 3705]|uniref:LamG domain-containing protein n=1 Tax=Lysinibacillus sp. CNPSo 3705 TaxID=3028148 RepID=UPI0023638698|nr:LamG domain-containing protein [Lysinibacillus sp. CNPSo 3705]MDD1502596.1 LamG domain-containing protein [Lysinibacillus sp. CNPSo 3705]